MKIAMHRDANITYLKGSISNLPLTISRNFSTDLFNNWASALQYFVIACLKSQFGFDFTSSWQGSNFVLHVLGCMVLTQYISSFGISPTELWFSGLLKWYGKKGFTVSMLYVELNLCNGSKKKCRESTNRHRWFVNAMFILLDPSIVGCIELDVTPFWEHIVI